MYRFIFLLSLCVFLSGCQTNKAKKSDGGLAKIRVQENILYYEGGLNKRSVDLAIEAAGGNRITLIRINSSGGEVHSAIELAKWIRANNMDVEVNEVCFSSCANYIFPAGINKYISKDDLLGWHGGAYQQSFPKAVRESKSMQRWREAETQLYKSLGVNPRLPTMGQEEEYYCQTNGQSGWYYTISSLGKLGIHNVVLTDNYWNPLELYSKKVCELNI